MKKRRGPGRSAPRPFVPRIKKSLTESGETCIKEERKLMTEKAEMKKVVLIICVVALVAAACLELYFAFLGTKGPDGARLYKLIEVEGLCQFPELPTGCEGTAAAMVLRYYGEDVTPVAFAADWLSCDDAFYAEDRRQYGPDPREVFAGDPASESGFGCFAPAIVSAVNENSALCRARDLSGKSLEDLCRDHIDKGEPLLIWATVDMKEPYHGMTWYLEDGSRVSWPVGEHCLVLAGYGEASYFLMDPQSGELVYYPKELVETRYDELDRQAVLITKQGT